MISILSFLILALSKSFDLLVINSKGKLLVYNKENPFSGSSHIEIINWYGEKVKSLKEYNATEASWGPSGLKLYFVSKNNESKGQLFSIWKDGTHLEQLTDYIIPISYPVVSPNGMKIAMSIKTTEGWDIFIFPFENY